MDSKQIDLGYEILDILKANSVHCNIIFGNCTIDINVVVSDIESQKPDLNTGIFRVFWHDKGLYNIGYLCAGFPFYDGYEVYNKWVRNISLDEIMNYYNTDVSNLAKYHNRFK